MQIFNFDFCIETIVDSTVDNFLFIQTRSSLKKYLSDYFEAVTLPKLFRFVDKIPENEQGKVLKSALIKLFDK